VIYTPRLCFPKEEFPRTCTKILFMGYEISIAMDASCGPGDLSRADIRVYLDDVDVTCKFWVDNETMLVGNGDVLFRVMQKIVQLST
jgi:hypothetical protein